MELINRDGNDQSFLSDDIVRRSTITVIDVVDPDIVQQIKELEYDTFGLGGLNEWHIPYVIRYGKLFVIELDSRIIGVAEFIRKWDQPDDVYLIGLCLDKKYQGIRLGKKFLKAIIGVMGREEIRNIFLTVDEENKAALNLYEGSDFKEIDCLRNEYGSGADRLLMKRELRNDSQKIF